MVHWFPFCSLSVPLVSSLGFVLLCLLCEVSRVSVFVYLFVCVNFVLRDCLSVRFPALLCVLYVECYFPCFVITYLLLKFPPVFSALIIGRVVIVSLCPLSSFPRGRVFPSIMFSLKIICFWIFYSCPAFLLYLCRSSTLKLPLELTFYLWSPAFGSTSCLPYTADRFEKLW